MESSMVLPRRPPSAAGLGRAALVALLLSGCAPGPSPSPPPGGRATPPPPVAVSVGEVELDPPTFHCLGLALPIVSGQANHVASVRVFYRKAGEAWKEGLPLLRVRPSTIADEDTDVRIGFTVREEFAGSLFDLDPDTAYEIRLEVVDPAGGSATRLVTARTRPLPRAEPLTPRLVPVSDAVQLRTALAEARPGDVITLAAGQYDGAIEITRSGTEDSPIFLRGRNQGGVVLRASGAPYGLTIRGSHVTVEDLTVQGSTWGARLLDVHDVVLRRLRITEVSMGIDAAGAVGADGALTGHRNRNVTICDNVLEGREAVWPNVDRRLWNFEGIVVVGSGHVICHNTLSGFGDSLGLDKAYTGGRWPDIRPEWYATPNRAIDFYGNDVLWGGDDGIELDLGQRNIRAFRNRIANTGMGVSFQPIWGGPAYAFRNVIYNTAKSPYKLNNDPSGFYIFHNAAIRAGHPWIQYSGQATNFRFHNNLTMGSYATSSGSLVLGTRVTLGVINWNGWFPDGPFQVGGAVWRSFDDLRRRSPYERNGVLLRRPFFERDPVLPRDHRRLHKAPDDLTLHAQSNAVDAGVVLPNINDGFTGSAPDLGVQERGQPPPVYGARPSGR